MTTHKVTLREAKRMIREPGVRCFITCQTQLPIEGKPGRAFSGLAYAKVSKAVALKVATELLDILEDRGARLPVTRTERCLFLG